MELIFTLILLTDPYVPMWMWKLTDRCLCYILAGQLVPSEPLAGRPGQGNKQRAEAACLAAATGGAPGWGGQRSGSTTTVRELGLPPRHSAGGDIQVPLL
jgi:hypothetical protein